MDNKKEQTESPIFPKQLKSLAFGKQKKKLKLNKSQDEINLVYSMGKSSMAILHQPENQFISLLLQNEKLSLF